MTTAQVAAVSHCQQQQSYSGLHSPGQSYSALYIDSFQFQKLPFKITCIKMLCHLIGNHCDFLNNYWYRLLRY